MRVFDRRREIVRLLQMTEQPLSAGKFAELFSVSRQIIVQDIAELKLEYPEIISTPRGYLWGKSARAERVFKVFHTDDEIEDELNTIIENGGRVESVFVYHRVYGKMTASLTIENKTHISDYVHALSGNSKPLKNITGGYHYHLVTADSESALGQIEESLRKKKYIVE